MPDYDNLCAKLDGIDKNIYLPNELICFDTQLSTLYFLFSAAYLTAESSVFDSALTKVDEIKAFILSKKEVLSK